MASESSGAKRIAAAIVAAGLIIALVPVVRDEVQAWRAQRALEAFAAQADALMKEAQRQAAIAAYHASSATAARASAESARVAAKRLRADEQCVSGTVLRRIEQPSTGFVQVLEGGRPVRCANGSRL